MADQQLAGVDEHGMLVILREVLAPIGQERVDQIISWVRREIQTRPLVGYCWDGQVEEAWEITKDSPISPGRTVFAMMHWEMQRAVVAYCFKKIQVDGREAVQFYREVIMDPKHITGPVSHTALFEDLRESLTDDASADRLLEHLKGKLDPKTFERVVEAADELLAPQEESNGAQPAGEA